LPTAGSLEILLLPLLEKAISDKECPKPELQNEIFKRLESLNQNLVYKGQAITLKSVLQTSQHIKILDAAITL